MDFFEDNGKAPVPITSNAPYFHGTGNSAAVESLLAGETLKPMRPSGTSKFSRSAIGLVYVTPSFNQAAEYSFMGNRADWPFQERSFFAATAHVFEFSCVDIAAEIEEDELGFAVKAALCRRAGHRHEWSMNSGFADALVENDQILEGLCEAADLALDTGRFKDRLRCPKDWKGADKTAVGRKMAKALSPALGQSLVDLGISVALATELRPIAAYALPKRVMQPEEAFEVWRATDNVAVPKCPNHSR